MAGGQTFPADDVSFEAQIVPRGDKRFAYSFTETGLDLTGFDTVEVALNIGIDTGTARSKS